MELLQLRYFATVARMLNISRAAEYHLIPQPAMSKTISKLEKELGVALFSRQKNRLMLTDDGEEFYSVVSQSLDNIDGVLLKIQQNRTLPRGEITLLVRQHRSFVIQSIASFKKKYPNVLFKVYYDEKTSHYYDFCITSSFSGQEFDQSTMLLNEKLELIVSANSELAEKKEIRVEELRNQDFAIVSQTSYQWQQIIELCNKAGFMPKLSAEFGDIQCLAQYVELDMAVTIGPKSSYNNLGKDLAFVTIDPEIRRPTFLFWNEARKTRALDLFREHIIEFFKTIS
ncbi:MAG: LysR family transcriptional regulator [Lachnospiraceae bacterium]|nr:LysR family transcriptional regulator [Lachnospiraceae bacterium]MBQ6196085.1 LysR family transcriptional regulator [Lachnospiraceae bacterium]